MTFKSFKKFVQTAKVRCGVDFKVMTVQRNAKNVITSVKGVVFIKQGEEPEVSFKEQDMYWNLNGQALAISEAYDLVQEEAFDSVKDSAAVIEL